MDCFVKYPLKYEADCMETASFRWGVLWNASPTKMKYIMKQPVSIDYTCGTHLTWTIKILPNAILFSITCIIHYLRVQATIPFIERCLRNHLIKFGRKLTPSEPKNSHFLPQLSNWQPHCLA